jgi:hypothetical protein
MNNLEEIYDYPTATESERDIARDAEAAIAYVRRCGLADEGDVLDALGLTSAADGQAVA